MEVLNYKQIDWAHYIARPKEFFLTNILVKDFKGTKLKKVFGFGHDYWLFLYRGGETVDLYRRTDELQESDAFAREIIKDKKKIRAFFTEAKKVIRKTEKLIGEYKRGIHTITNPTAFKRYYQQAIGQIVDYFVYVIEIPYIVGNILETDNKLGDAEYRSILTECEHFRSMSHYPDFYQYVLSYLVSSLASLLYVRTEELAFVTADEIFSFLEGKLTRKKILQNVRERKDGFVCFAAFGTEEFVNDQKFLQSFYPKIQKGITAIKGNIAYKGVVRGKVTVVISRDDFSKFRDGDILVTIQSNPSFMPVIIKSAAIVADEGGIMCHAAIVSRELKKPCIIGTKIATKVLKDGDVVEVDANNGTVKIIEKAKGK